MTWAALVLVAAVAGYVGHLFGFRAGAEYARQRFEAGLLEAMEANDTHRPLEAAEDMLEEEEPTIYTGEE